MFVQTMFKRGKTTVEVLEAAFAVSTVGTKEKNVVDSVQYAAF